MRISAKDMQRVLNPELRDPELERRRLTEIEWARRLGPLAPNWLKEGIPIPGLMLPKRTEPDLKQPAVMRPAGPTSAKERRRAVAHAIGSLRLEGFEISSEREQQLYDGVDLDAMRSDVVAVLGADQAERWFQTPNADLGEQSPQEVGATPEGRERLRQLIGALLDGAFV